MKEEINKGIKYMLFASFLFALMGAVAKELSNSMSSVEVSFFRNVFGVFIILFALYRKPPKQIGGKPWLLFFRGFAGFVSLLMFFYMISVVPLGEAMTFSKTSTIFTAVLAYVFLKEKLGIKGWIGVFIGFIGIVFITKFDARLSAFKELEAELRQSLKSDILNTVIRIDNQVRNSQNEFKTIFEMKNSKCIEDYQNLGEEVKVWLN
jgi:drug/metabolite transporter (DMT)-like permease